jgi:hypothetical protein
MCLLRDWGGLLIEMKHVSPLPTSVALFTAVRFGKPSPGLKPWAMICNHFAVLINFLSAVCDFLFRHACQIQETLHALCGPMTEEASLIGEFE